MFRTIRTFFRETLAPVTLKGIAARAGSWVNEAYKCVETSRYTHATCGQTRVWFSKPAVSRLSGGLVVEQSGDRIDITVTDYRGFPVGRPVSIDPEVAQGMGAMLRSAAVRADTSTARKMDRSRWETASEQARNIADRARFEASLFNGI